MTCITLRSTEQPGLGYHLLNVIGTYTDMITKEACYLATHVSWTALSNSRTKIYRKGGQAK